ncbi:MAG: type IV pili twitching motility protein PilT, partial [Elusimicrobia bacterium]|nr:type IV pili twitching motility protein PilT [Elusimicrobiota bacterium]
AVICQQLLVHASGQGRVLAAEILMATSAIRNLIREQKIEQVQLAIQTGGKFGMQTMNQSLADLYRRQRATLQEVMAHSLDPEDLRRLLQRTAAPA